MIRLAEKNVYGDSLRPETSIVPELLEAGIRLRRELAKEHVQLRSFADWGGEIPQAAIFWDCPRMEDPELQICLQKRIPFLLVISENMHLQPNPTYRQIKELASRVLTYQQDEVDQAKTFWLPYGLDLEAGKRFRQSSEGIPRPYLLGMINAWKKSEMPGDLYARRNWIAMGAGKILGSKMFLAGPGWDQPLVYEKKWQRSLAKRIPALVRWWTGWPNAAYRGPLPLGNAKLPALAQCEFALVPENCFSLAGYITEKIFNALFAGCIPIYQGHPDSSRWLPREIFVPMDQFTDGATLVNFLQTMPQKKKEELKQAGRNFLDREEARQFDISTWTSAIKEQIFAIKKES